LHFLTYAARRAELPSGDTRPKLVFEPDQEIALMFRLNGATGVAPSDMLSWPLGLDAGALLVQEVGQAGHQRRWKLEVSLQC
jgi:hypothetical protein